MKISMMIGLLLLLIGGGVAYSWCGSVQKSEKQKEFDFVKLSEGINQTVTIDCPPLGSFATDVITITPKQEFQGDLFNGWEHDGEPGEVITVNVNDLEHPNSADEIFKDE